MSFSRLVAMLPVLGFVSLPASVEAENSRRETGMYSVRLVDDSLITLRLLTEEIEITTAYGSLKVPVSDIRRIDLGYRDPAVAAKLAEVEAAVVRLGDARYDVREAAGKELVGLKGLAYPALRRAVQSKDPEIKWRATALVRQLGGHLTGDQLALQGNDVIITNRFPVIGRIEGLNLKGRSRILGEVQLRRADIQQVRSLTVESAGAHELFDPIRVEFRNSSIRSPEPGMYEVRLADGGLMDMRLISKEIEITTRGGKLKIPMADVRRIGVGFRYAEGIEKQVKAAVARLGDAKLDVREAAEEELLQLKESAYLELRQAVHSKDAEVKRRATGLIREFESKLNRDELELQYDDVIVTAASTFTGRIGGVSLKVQSRLFGDAQLQLTDIRQVRSLTAELAATRVLLERISEAVRANRTARSQKMGTGKNSYEEAPKEGALLIGFEVTYSHFGSSLTVQTVRPIFLARTGRVSGTTHGIPGERLVRVEAKPGYAVGGVTIKAGLGVDGMSVTFMEITNEGLNPDRAYESEWLGGSGGDTKTKVACTGAPVVGIFGATAEGTTTFNGLGLVTAEVR